MRIDRVLKQYQPVLDYREKENIYQQIVKDYSVMNISVSDFAVLMDLKWNIKYEPEKIGKSELTQKEENSKILREKTAKLAARSLCTDLHELKNYKHLALLLDYSATKEAWSQNKKDSEVLVHGSKEEKTALFWDKLKPLLALKKSVLEAKTDGELANRWGEWQPLFQQFRVLDKIVEEAKEVGVEISPKIAGRMKNFQEETKLSIHMLECRAGMAANVYYSKLSEAAIQKIGVSVLDKIAKATSMTLRDYIQDNIDILNCKELHIKKQLQDRLEQIGYSDPKEAVFGNIKGDIYNFEAAVEVLKTQKPVYLMGENKKIIHMIQIAGQNGALKTSGARKKEPTLSDYLKKEEVLMEKLISEKKPLSEEGVKAARLYMAKAVCYEKVLGEKRLGNGQLYHLLSEDEQKFVKAANKIYRDPVFEKLTKNITLEQLEDFVTNCSGMELNKKYIQELMVPKQEKEVVVNVAF